MLAPSSSARSRHSPCNCMALMMVSPAAVIAVSKCSGPTAGGVDAHRRPQPGGLGGREPFGGSHLVEHRVTAGPQDPPELAEGGLQVLDVHENVPAPGQVGAAVRVGLAMLDCAMDYLAAADPTAMPAQVEADCLAALERLHARETVVQAAIPGAFTASRHAVALLLRCRRVRRVCRDITQGWPGQLSNARRRAHAAFENRF